MFSKISKIFEQFKSKDTSMQTVQAVNFEESKAKQVPTEEKTFTKSKGIKSADIVFVGGVVAMIATAIYMIRPASVETEPPPFKEANNLLVEPTGNKSIDNLQSREINITKEAPKVDMLASPPGMTLEPGDPFTQKKEMQKPWYEEKNGEIEDIIIPKVDKVKNIEKRGFIKSKANVIVKNLDLKKVNTNNVNIAKEEASKSNMRHDSIQSAPSKIKETVVYRVKEELEDNTLLPTYMCRITEAFSHLIGKEIVTYTYVQKGNTMVYAPAYKALYWDEKGIVVKERFMALAVDIERGMVEIETKKWIPALKFASCTVVEGSD